MTVGGGPIRSGSPHLLALCAAFLVSGLAGLIYQVVWVRAFGNVFGNSTHSAAFVTAIFMLGLGAGSYTLGRWADGHFGKDRGRVRAPAALLRAYAYLEAGIGLLGLLTSLALPLLEPLSALLSGYELDESGFYLPTLGVRPCDSGSPPSSSCPPPSSWAAP